MGRLACAGTTTRLRSVRRRFRSFKKISPSLLPVPPFSFRPRGGATNTCYSSCCCCCCGMNKFLAVIVATAAVAIQRRRSSKIAIFLATFFACIDNKFLATIEVLTVSKRTSRQYPSSGNRAVWWCSLPTMTCYKRRYANTYIEGERATCLSETTKPPNDKTKNTVRKNKGPQHQARALLRRRQGRTRVPESIADIRTNADTPLVIFVRSSLTLESTCTRSLAH